MVRVSAPEGCDKPLMPQHMPAHSPIDTVPVRSRHSDLIIESIQGKDVAMNRPDRRAGGEISPAASAGIPLLCTAFQHLYVGLGTVNPQGRRGDIVQEPVRKGATRCIRIVHNHDEAFCSLRNILPRDFRGFHRPLAGILVRQDGTLSERIDTEGKDVRAGHRSLRGRYGRPCC